MDKDLNLNTSGDLPDGTAASQAGGFGASASQVKKGFTDAGTGDDPIYVDDPNAPANSICSRGLDAVSGPESGGFLQRANGWQR